MAILLPRGPSSLCSTILLSWNVQAYRKLIHPDQMNCKEPYGKQYKSNHNFYSPFSPFPSTYNHSIVFYTYICLSLAYVLCTFTFFIPTLSKNNLHKLLQFKEVKIASNTIWRVLRVIYIDEITTTIKTQNISINLKKLPVFFCNPSFPSSFIQLSTDLLLATND